MNRSRRYLAVSVVAVVGLLAVVAAVSWGSGSPPESSSPPDAIPATSGPSPVPSTSSTTSATAAPPAGSPTIVVHPEDDLAALAAAQPPGATFVLLPGIHRPEPIIPRHRQVFIGRPGSVLSGAVVLTSFVQRDDLWLIEGQQLESRVHGECNSDRPRCGHSYELFIDDRVLTHVGSVSEVGPGTWFFDYERDTIYLGEDPAGRDVELSVQTQAFRGDVDGVVIRDLVIEKFATPAQQGAIDSRRDNNDIVGGADWVITGNVVRWNHGVGIAATTGALVEDNLVYENGQLGLAAKGAGVTFAGNEVYGNNTAGFSSGWEAGGSKFAFTSGLVVRDNYVHDNAGVGLWTDIDNIDTLYEGNRVINNDRMGIFHEISYDAVIANNEVRGNGFGFDAWLWGGGIAVATSVNVQIYGNLVEGNADGIVGIDQDRSEAPASHGPLSLVNLDVHDNLVTANQGWTGLGQDIGDNAVFTTSNNRFYDNVYEQPGRHFFWLNDPRTYEEWLGFGQS